MLVRLAQCESGPSDAAVSYLIDVARERVDLGKDTALFSGTTKEKRKFIWQQYDRLTQLVGEGELEAVAEKVDGDLAAVLVSQVVHYDPLRVDVFAIGMLKRNDKWLPAPVLSSFENTGITYLPHLSAAAERLELWMLSERTKQLGRIRASIQAKLRADIRQAVDITSFRKMSPEQVTMGFIDACRNQELPRALAFAGGLEDSLPSDWQDILNFISSNLSVEREADSAWQKLIQPDESQAVVHSEIFDDGATVSIGSFSPLGSSPGITGINIFHFPLKRTDADQWRLKLPSWLLENSLPATPDPADEPLAEAFPAKLLERTPKQSFDDPRALVEALQKNLSNQGFETILPYFDASGEKGGMRALEQAAQLWQDFRGRADQVPLLLEVKELNDEACALLSIFKFRNPQITSRLIHPLTIVKDGGQWKVRQPSGDPLAALDAELREWAAEAIRLNSSEWLKRLNLTVALDAIPADSAPTEKEALEAANSWLEMIESRNPGGILETVATFDDDRGFKKLFQTIGHELQDKSQTEIQKIHRNGRWAAVSILAKPTGDGDRPRLLLYPIVKTERGPRILAEAVLYHTDTRSREYLNSSTFARLEERIPEAAVTELQEIQKAHNSLAESP